MPKFLRKFTKRSGDRSRVNIEPALSNPRRVSEVAQKQSLSNKLRLLLPGRKAEEPTKVPDFGAELRKQRASQKRAGQFKDVSKIFTPLRRVRPGILTITIVAIVLLLSGFIVSAHTNGVYILSQIEVTGTKEIAAGDILASVEHLRGASLFSFSEGGIEQQLKADFPYIKSAEVRKQLPGKLVIDIEERFPIFSYINLVGVYLVDEERVVVNALEVRVTDPLTEQELLIIDGYGDPNADFVHEKYLSTIDDEEERAEVEWDEVDMAVKEQTLVALRSDLMIRVQTRLNDKAAALAAAGLDRLTKVEGFDANSYEIGGLFPQIKTETSRAVIRYLKDLDIIIQRLVWQSEFSVRAELADGLAVIFSSTRDIESQLRTLEILRQQGELRDARIIDLRSELVTIR